jgi:hypothetical protein
MGFPDIHAFPKKIIAANTDTQIFTAPWRVRRRYFMKSMVLTNEDLTNDALVKFYDDDLSSGTPPIRGNSASDATAAPLLEFWVKAKTTLILDEKSIPREYFCSGMVGNSSVANVVVMPTIQED